MGARANPVSHERERAGVLPSLPPLRVDGFSDRQNKPDLCWAGIRSYIRRT